MISYCSRTEILNRIGLFLATCVFTWEGAKVESLSHHLAISKSRQMVHGRDARVGRTRD